MFRIALRALAKNKLRASLTILGLVIGIAAVTTMVSLGQSASDMVQTEFQSFGTNMILVFPGERRGARRSAGTSPNLTDKDCYAIIEECRTIMDATPIVGAGGQVARGENNWSPREMMGVGPGYLLTCNWRIGRGGFFTERDVQSAKQVCVIGKTIVTKLFGQEDPIGASIRIRNIPFRVIGTLKEKGAGITGDDQDDMLLLPYTTVSQRLYRSRFSNVHAILASAKAPELMAEAQREVTQLLLERHRIAPGNPPDFAVKNTAEFAAGLGKVTGILTLLLASIAAISLLVGGVGIMNIMLVSVTERTREIGIRMAVGAKGRDILFQFLVESIMLSLIGGLIGFSLGVATSMGATHVINQFSSTKWPLAVSFSAGCAAVIFSALVGMFFGFYPALRASRLDPIDALRYE